MALATDSKLAIQGGEPLLTLEDHRSWPLIEADDQDAVSSVIERGVLSGNSAPEMVAFEREFAAFAQTEYAVMAHSGTAALAMSLFAAGVGKGDEVIFPAYGFLASPVVALSVGAIPKYVDIELSTGTLDPAKLEDVITERTKAIMPVHIHGMPADMTAIGAVADKHNLIVVEDAAQAHGATFMDKAVGGLRDGGGFSLQSSKNLSAGEGGVYVTNNEAYAERANAFRNFGQRWVRLRAIFRINVDPSTPKKV